MKQFANNSETSDNHYLPAEVLKPYVIVDIDGVLADCTHRLHHILGEEKNWHEFDLLTPYDEPIEETIFIINMLSRQGFRIILMTGRGERVYEETRTWLEYHHVDWHELHMRSEGDRRPAWKVKTDNLAIQDLGPASVFCVFEDEPDTVAELRSLGYLVYDPLEWQNDWKQVNEGGKDHAD